MVNVKTPDPATVSSTPQRRIDRCLGITVHEHDKVIYRSRHADVEQAARLVIIDGRYVSQHNDRRLQSLERLYRRVAPSFIVRVPDLLQPITPRLFFDGAGNAVPSTMRREDHDVLSTVILPVQFVKKISETTTLSLIARVVPDGRPYVVVGPEHIVVVRVQASKSMWKLRHSRGVAAVLPQREGRQVARAVRRNPA